MIEALAIAGAIATCSWDRPGHNAYTGPVPAAVERYADIPPDVRRKLRQRMERRAYDDVAAITRDRIVGAHEYTDLRAMHFGRGQVCASVTRTRWAPEAIERGLIYCEAGHCIIVPTVCRNVARVTRIEPPPAPPGDAPPAGPSFTDALQPPPGTPLAISTAPMPAFAEPDPLPAADGTPALAPHWAAPPGIAPWPAPLPPLPAPPLVPVPPPIPEPATWLMMLAGLAGIAGARRHLTR